MWVAEPQYVMQNSWEIFPNIPGKINWWYLWSAIGDDQAYADQGVRD